MLKSKKLSNDYELSQDCPFELRPPSKKIKAEILTPQYIEQQLTHKSHEPEKPNHILLFTVLNPHYTVMRFLDLKETSTDMAADWIFEKFKLI